MALSRIPSRQFTVNSNITIPTGKKLNAVDAAGLYAPGCVLQVVQNAFNIETAFTSLSYVDVTSSATSLIAKGVNSKFVITYIGQSYKSGTTDGFGLQLYRVTQSAGAIWTPYSTWGAQGHDSASSNGESVQLQYIDSPNANIGETVTYKFRVAKYAAGTGYINYGAPGSTWSGYNNGTSIIIWEIAQ